MATCNYTIRQVSAAKFILAMGLGMTLLFADMALAKNSSSKKNASAEAISNLKFQPGDEGNNDKKAVVAELFIASQEEKAIEQAKKLLNKYRGTTLEADILMRLGELHMRRAKSDRVLEVHRKSEEIVNIAPKLIQGAASKKQVQLAINYFDTIQKKHPHFDKMDSVVFNNAFANQQLNDYSKAERLFVFLVANFANSPLIPDSHLALGEIQFQRRHFKDALTHFQAIRNYPDSLVYPYGLYKGAWTKYNMRDAVGALADLEDVIRYGKYVKEQGIDARLDLRKEALMDMTLFFEDVLPAEKAYKYFQTQASELDVSPIILRLSDLYKRHGKNREVTVVLTEFIQNKKMSDSVPIAYAELMEAYEKLKKRKDVVTLLSSLGSICEVKSAWSKSQIELSKESPLRRLDEDGLGIDSAQKLCQMGFTKMALGYANKWLKYWSKEPQSLELADAAESAFALYLEKSDKNEDAAKARFVYAELLFKRNKFRPASENYALVSTVSKNDKMNHDSRYFALTSLEKAVGAKWSDNDEDLFRGLAKEYLTFHKTGPYVLDIEFRVALIAYEKGRYDEAEPIFLRLGESFKDKEKGLKAQDLYMDTLNIKKNFVALRNYSLKLRDSTKDEERKNKYGKIHEEAYFQVIQEMETKKDYLAAISEYTAFANKNPKSSLSQKALWNAMQLNFNINQWSEGANAAVAYHEKYKGTKDGQDALLKAAQIYESLAQLNEAAAVLVKLALEDNANKTKWNMLAADYYTLNRDYSKAKPIYEDIKSKANSDISFRALEQLELIATAESQVKQREQYLREIASLGRQPQASQASLYFLEQTYAQGKQEDSFAMAKKILSQQKSGASRKALARARFIQAQIIGNEFKNQSVKAKLERVQTVLLLKTEKLSRAQVAYQEAANYGDALTTVMAYKELADCYLQYSEALRTMPVPAGIPEAEAEAFRQEMDKLAIPMEEKGIDGKMQALKVARELGVYDDVVSQLQNEMKSLNQAVDSRQELVRFEPAQLVLPKPKGVGT